MKNQKFKIVVIVIFLLAAGIYYSYSRNNDKVPYDKSAGGEYLLAETIQLEGSENSEDKSNDKSKDESQAGELEDRQLEAGKLKDRESEAGEEMFSVSQKETENGKQEEQVSACFVHICGEVISPGVYEMEEGSRIFQAVDIAGGFTEFAASQYLNMAESVQDGMKIVVPDIRRIKELEPEGKTEFGVSVTGGVVVGGVVTGGVVPGGAGSVGAAGGVGSGSTGAGNPEGGSMKQKVNLNTATMEELMTLRGVGEAKARDIIKYREEHGGFGKIEDIMRISGIKNAAFEKIKDDITV